MHPNPQLYIVASMLALGSPTFGPSNKNIRKLGDPATNRCSHLVAAPALRAIASGHQAPQDVAQAPDRTTPSSHSKNSATKICSKGWVAQKPFLIGSLTAALRLSKGWVRKYLNLLIGIGCASL